MPTPFQLWVANAIAECGGNPALYIYGSCGPPSKEALTSAVDSMAPCQGVFDIYFDGDYLESAPVFTVATTNKTWLH